MILIVINIARKRRGKCKWQFEQVRKKTWGAIAGIVVALGSPIFINAPPSSPIAILLIALLLYSVFVLSKALYRKADALREVARQHDVKFEEYLQEWIGHRFDPSLPSRYRRLVREVVLLYIAPLPTGKILLLARWPS